MNVYCPICGTEVRVDPVIDKVHVDVGFSSLLVSFHQAAVQHDCFGFEVEGS